jgi:hypothetical protein
MSLLYRKVLTEDKEVSMKRFRSKCLLMAACLLALATALAFTRAYAEEKTVAPPLTDVNVVNTIKNPIPVGDIQNPAFKPFQVDARFSLRRGEGAAEAVLGDPGSTANQRVVIEHVTVGASMPDGQKVVVYIKIGEIMHSLVLTSQGLWGTSRRFRASQPIRLYTDGGQDGIAFAGVERSSTTGTASFYFTVSGHLATLP